MKCTLHAERADTLPVFHLTLYVLCGVAVGTSVVQYSEIRQVISYSVTPLQYIEQFNFPTTEYI